MNRRRIEFIIAGILAICGCAIIIVGVVMGGRPGSFNNVNGRLVYQNSRESIDVAEAPSWLGNFDSICIFRSGLLVFSTSEELPNLPSESSGIEANNGYGHGNEHGTGEITSFSGSSQTVISGETLDLSGFDKFNIDVDFGYVTIQSGGSPQLYVEGYLSANVWAEDGAVNIESEYNDKNITNKVIDGVTHYFRDGKDITTHFTIILPEQLDELDAKLGAGAMEISSLNTAIFSADAELGTIDISNVTSQETELQVDMGSIKATGHSTGIADLDCNLGAIKFSGNVTDYFEAQCSMGSIEAGLPQPAGYGYDIDNNLGSIVLGGKSFAVSSDSEKEGGGGGGDIMFYLTCDLGSIVVKFEG